jgi:murein DD-endopeptidase MepM/ murein hydrolase activator NlpD
LARSGSAGDEANRVVGLIATAVTPAEIAPGTVISMTLGRRSGRGEVRPLERLEFRPRFDLRLTVRRAAGALTLLRQPIAVVDRPLRIQGTVGSGLLLAAQAAGVPAPVIGAYIGALNQRVPIGSIEADDRFDLVVTYRRAATGEAQFGGLRYAGLRQRGRDIGMMPWVYDGKVQWFDGDGIGERRNGMHVPVDSMRVTSNFGMRMHPLLGYARMHSGIDIGAHYGAPVMAVTDGVVRFAGWHGGHGNYVQLAHGEGLMTGYGHLSAIVARPGTRVTAGQVIGYVGSTGLSTGPHLHYEVFRDGVAINPTSLRFSSVIRLAGDELTQFKARFAELLAVRPRGQTRMASAPNAPKS